MLRSLVSRCCDCCCRPPRHREKDSGGDDDSHRKRTKAIETELREERRRKRNEVRLLLLGAGESGKSTFVKQMRIINNVVFTPLERQQFRQLIHVSLIRGLQVVLAARKQLGIPLERGDLEQPSEMVLLFDSYESINPENIGDLAVLAKRLWRDKGVKETFSRRSEFQVVDSVGYFLDNLDRVSRRDYEPSNQDILYARRTTQEVSEFRVKINKMDFVFLDVGGQRSQREKWFKLFSQDMAGTLFMVSASEFDQKLREDSQENRLKESTIIFRTIVNNTAFKDTTFILFVNKMDLLEEKVKCKRADISREFDQFGDTSEVKKVLKIHTGLEFKGDPFDVTDVKNFVLSMFLSQINLEKSSAGSTYKKTIYHHFTVATNTENIRLVFDSVKDSILRKNLDELMLH